MNDFSKIVQLIKTAQSRALSSVNSELVNLYWQVGQYVSRQLENTTWGDGTVKELARYIQKHHPEIKGFDKKNLYRMCRFYQVYTNLPFVAPLVRQIQQTDNEINKIVAPVVRQLPGTPFDLNGLNDIHISRTTCAKRCSTN
jgi:hypothetical protein